AGCSASAGANRPYRAGTRLPAKPPLRRLGDLSRTVEEPSTRHVMLLRTSSIRSSGKWGDADEEHQPRVRVVAHTVWDTGRCPDGEARAGGPGLATDDEPALAFDHEVELVLALVLVEMLLLTRRQTVEAEHQPVAAKQGGLELFVGQGAHV